MKKRLLFVILLASLVFAPLVFALDDPRLPTPTPKSPPKEGSGQTSTDGGTSGNSSGGSGSTTTGGSGGSSSTGSTGTTTGGGGANSATSNVVCTKVGKPGKEIPPECLATSGWPFKVKSPAQFRRVDQGWDLKFEQRNGSRIEILSLTSGTIYHQGKLSGADGGGFGPHYPVVKLDPPGIKINGRTYTAIYYGHVAMLGNLKDGDRVTPGQPIAWSGPHGGCDPAAGVSCGGNNGGSYWLEVGFDQGNANPVADRNEPYPTVAGLDMVSFLLSIPMDKSKLPRWGY